MELITSVNRLISQPNGLSRNYDPLLMQIAQFNEYFADPGVDAGPECDELKPLLTTLDAQLPVELELQIARMLKILLRKSINRDNVGKFGVKCIIRALLRQTQKITAATAEIGNVTVNCCYDGANVMQFLEEGGIAPLMHLLRARDTAVQASALGALQGVCYVSWGRHAILADSSVVTCLMTSLLLHIILTLCRPLW